MEVNTVQVVPLLCVPKKSCFREGCMITIGPGFLRDNGVWLLQGGLFFNQVCLYHCQFPKLHLSGTLVPDLMWPINKKVLPNSIILNRVHVVGTRVRAELPANGKQLIFTKNFKNCIMKNDSMFYVFNAVMYLSEHHFAMLRNYLKIFLIDKTDLTSLINRKHEHWKIAEVCSIIPFKFPICSK